MNPHVACQFWELEKHLRVLWRAANDIVLRTGEANADTVRIVWL